MRLTRMKAVVFAAVIALLSLSLLVAGTFALFSDKKESNVHLQAATLEAKLYRTLITGKKVNGSGSVVDFEDKTSVDLEKDDTALFALDKILPGVEQEITLRIENHGTAAFDYSVSVVNVQAESEADKALLSQMKITVTNSKGTVTEFYLSEYAQKGQNIPLGTLLGGEETAAEEFKIKASFIDSGEIDNSAMNAKAVFDLSVLALQSAVQ